MDDHLGNELNGLRRLAFEVQEAVSQNTCSDGHCLAQSAGDDTVEPVIGGGGGGLNLAVVDPEAGLVRPGGIAFVPTAVPR